MPRINLVFDYILWARLNKIQVGLIKSKRLLPIPHNVTYKQRILQPFLRGFPEKTNLVTISLYLFIKRTSRRKYLPYGNKK